MCTASSQRWRSNKNVPRLFTAIASHAATKAYVVPQAEAKIKSKATAAHSNRTEPRKHESLGFIKIRGDFFAKIKTLVITANVFGWCDRPTPPENSLPYRYRKKVQTTLSRSLLTSVQWN